MSELEHNCHDDCGHIDAETQRSILNDMIAHTKCICGHEQGRHELDEEYQELWCIAEDCYCTEFFNPQKERDLIDLQQYETNDQL